MSAMMEEEIKRWTARRKSALVLEIIQGKTTVAEASRQFDLPPSEIEDWVSQGKAGMENALKAKPEDVRDQYERQLKDLQEAYGEAIFGSRPWRLSGEGPTQVASGSFGEGKLKPFQAADIRFTTKGSTLYAMTLGKPAGTVTIRSLAGAGTVRRIEIVGTPGALSFSQDGAGVHITVPRGAAHDYGVALKIDGDGLV